MKTKLHTINKQLARRVQSFVQEEIEKVFYCDRDLRGAFDESWLALSSSFLIVARDQPVLDLYTIPRCEIYRIEEETCRGAVIVRVKGHENLLAVFQFSAECSNEAMQFSRSLDENTRVLESCYE